MKALIIILALVGVSFIGLLIYGSGRDQEPKRKCQKLQRDSNGDYKVPDDWCPPGIAKATRSLQARFAPGLDLRDPDKAVIRVNPNQDNFFDVPALTDPDKRRTAKLTLVSGNSAIVEGPKDAKQCLCQPGQFVAPQLQGSACSDSWQEEHRENAWVCQKAGKWGSIPIEWTGGRLKFAKGPAAEVEVK